MITANGSQRRAGRRARAAAVTLLAAGALAAGCASAPAGSQAGSSASPRPSGSAAPGTSPASATPASGAVTSGPVSSGPVSSGPVSSGSASAPGVSGSAPAASGTATPVPTVSGGAVPAGEVACAGWPSSAPTGTLPVSFAPVTAERCVDSVQVIAGKGLWSTATLQRADGDLSALVTALRQPSIGHRPGTMCPALAEIPPAVVLISSTGQKLIPRIPLSGCGLIQSSVTAALGQLRWTTVSVRLLSPVSGASPTASGSPRALQTVGVSS